MNQTDMEQGLDYNTSREKMAMPEYGRNVLKMVQKLKEIPDRQKRSSQAAAVIKVMETLNPGVHQLENYEHKLWDQLYMIAGFDLDVADEAIGKGIEAISEYRLKVPEGMSLGKVSPELNFSRPGLGIGPNPQGKNRKQKNNRRGNKKK